MLYLSMWLAVLACLLGHFVRLTQATDTPSYQPCPLLRAYYPPPTLKRTSMATKALSQTLNSVFNDLVRTGKSDDFGSITPNTTSFAVVLFSQAEEGIENPIIYDYYYTVPGTKKEYNITSDSVFPIGTLTQLFTVYTWLVELGDQNWDDPVTKFLPELEFAPVPANGLAVEWHDITIGALAGHMAGIAQDSHACKLGELCDRQKFVSAMAQSPSLFLSDTTPIFSNAAFQVLAFALAHATSRTFRESLSEAVFQPLNMTQSTLLNEWNTTRVFGEGLNASASGEQAALSMLSTASDLSRAGHAMLTSRLLPPATTRRWLQPAADTSNLRNGVGRPWEIYRAGTAAGGSPTAPILDVFLKAGAVAQYSSYFGLAPDVGAGFAILAHNAGGSGRGGGGGGDGAADLNVYADVVAGGLGKLLAAAAEETAVRYAGVYGGADGGDEAVFNVSSEGPGLVLSRLVLGGRDFRAESAVLAGITMENLDFRIYPTNVRKGRLHQFVGVLQDVSAPVDMGTPTCITWMTVDGLGPNFVNRFLFKLDEDGSAMKVAIPLRRVTLNKVK